MWNRRWGRCLVCLTNVIQMALHGMQGNFLHEITLNVSVRLFCWFFATRGSSTDKSIAEVIVKRLQTVWKVKFYFEEIEPDKSMSIKAMPLKWIDCWLQSSPDLCPGIKPPFLSDPSTSASNCVKVVAFVGSVKNCRIYGLASNRHGPGSLMDVWLRLWTQMPWKLEKHFFTHAP